MGRREQIIQIFYIIVILSFYENETKRKEESLKCLIKFKIKSTQNTPFELALQYCLDLTSPHRRWMQNQRRFTNHSTPTFSFINVFVDCYLFLLQLNNCFVLKFYCSFQFNHHFTCILLVYFMNLKLRCYGLTKLQFQPWNVSMFVSIYLDLCSAA